MYIVVVATLVAHILRSVLFALLNRILNYYKNINLRE